MEALAAAKQLKDLKKEIKFWETAFQDQNGRKPEKGDIAKEPDMGRVSSWRVWLPPYRPDF